jgi:hypothetical protein
VVAGPAVTEPSATAKLLPWQGQLIVPLATSRTAQPWWVQVALSALNVPDTGWG